jgi:hypothetical protein
VSQLYNDRDPLRNRLSPRFINKAKWLNGYIVMRNSSYNRSKINKKKLKSIELATEDIMKLRRPELHNDAPKKVTTQQAPPPSRPQRSSVFTQSPNAERVTTTTSPRGSRHPQASPSLAPQRWDFARKNLATFGTSDY